jgi:hypothetical protein
MERNTQVLTQSSAESQAPASAPQAETGTSAPQVENTPPAAKAPAQKPLTEQEKKEAEQKRKARLAAKAYRDRYFAYYDDVKTKIKEDW